MADLKKKNNGKQWQYSFQLGFHIAGAVIGGILAIIIIALIFGFAVKFLWNMLIPELFGLSVINYYQAVGLVVLAKLIFGFHVKGGHGAKKKYKKYKCSKSDNGNWKKWKYYDDFWKNQGEAAFDEYVKEIEKSE